MSDKLKMIPIKDIKVGERFRTDLGDIVGLTESISEKGVLQPITVRADTSAHTGLVDGYTLLAGGRRIAAATAAGLDKIPALIRDQSGQEDSEVDLREVELIENTFRKDFTWDEQVKLIARLDTLCREKNAEWSVRKTAKILGHSHPMNVSRALQLNEALEAMPELVNCKTQDEAAKMVKKMEEHIIVGELRRRQEQVQDQGLRDVLTLAKNNYKIGDALVELAKLPAGAGNLDLIEVDPPYGIDLPDMKRGDAAATYKEVERDAYADFLKQIAEQTFRIASTNCWMVFWFGPTHQHLVLTTLRAAGWEVDEIPAIWVKPSGQTMQPEVHLGRAYEPFFICRKGRPALMKHGRSNVFEFAPVPGQKKIHPTERPVELLEEIIMTLCGINSKLHIPFLGSGNSLRAAYNLGCTGWGYDLNPEYKDRFLLAVQSDTEKLNANDGDA